VAGRIRDADVALVRERSPIAEVVGDHVALRNAGGGSLKGLCPFHDEKTPSFTVSPERAFYFCFGCQAGGDVISFVQSIESLTFPEAVEQLARRAGVELVYEQGGSSVRSGGGGERKRLLAAHAAAQEFFAAQLAEAPEARIARDFLSSRGFDEAACAPYGVGYAPRGWDTMVDHLSGRGFSRDELLKGGLASQGRRGPVDRFRGRLVWPIRDKMGDVIGFGARRLHDDDTGPKYLNTPDTPLYHKSTVLYGLDLAKREIAQRRQAVVVEGYTDVMACHLAGVATAVATCGTAFGPEHISVLRPLLLDSDEFRGEVVFTFDGDAAGQKAAMRAFDDDQRFVSQTFVAVEPNGLDPCDLRLAKGDAAVRDLVSRRVPLSEFAIRSVLERYDLELPEGRVAALAATAPVVARIKDRALRPEYARRLAGWLGMDVDPVLARVGELARSHGRAPERADPRTTRRDRPDAARAEGSAGAGPARPRPDDPALALEREAIKAVVQRPALAGESYATVETEVFTSPAYAAVHAAIVAAGGPVSAGEGGEPWIARIRDASTADATRSLVGELAVEPLHAAGEADARYVVSQLAALRERAVTRQVAELKGKVQRVDPVDSPADYNRLFAELLSLESRRRSLREQALGVL
jgi:DNA primase